MSPQPRKPLGYLHSIRLFLLLLLMFDAPSASAEPTRGGGTVILLQPTNTSVATRQSLARIRDELSADRFRVIWEGSDTTDDPGAVIESTGRDTDPNTVLVLFGDPATGEAELRVVQRAAGRSAVRQATVVVDDPERMPEALASKALDLLRATALELSLALDRAPRARDTPVRRPEVIIPQRPSPAVPMSGASIVSVDMGLGMWKSIEGPSPAVTPVGRLGLRVSGWSQARLSVAGLGSRPLVHTAYGTATISQTVALLEFALVPRLDNRIQALLSLGGGVLNVAVAGSGVAPYEGLTSQQWSAAVDGGAGIAVALGSHTSLATEIHALLASPHPVVRFVCTRAATIGDPALMLTLTLRVLL